MWYKNYMMIRKGPKLLTIYDCTDCKFIHSTIENSKNVLKCRKLLGRVLHDDYKVRYGDVEILQTPIDCPMLGRTEEEEIIYPENTPIG